MTRVASLAIAITIDDDGDELGNRERRRRRRGGREEAGRQTDSGKDIAISYNKQRE